MKQYQSLNISASASFSTAQGRENERRDWTKYPGPTAAENVAAGGDLFMPGRQGDVDCICAALSEGTLPRSAVLESAGRVVRMCRELAANKADGRNQN